MSDTASASLSIENPLRRRPWTAPQLVVHESMMVLTQHFFGAPSVSMMLQGTGISCGGGDNGPPTC
jgi:hypothetical protein